MFVEPRSFSSPLEELLSPASPCQMHGFWE
jgi:hypothetical protein